MASKPKVVELLFLVFSSINTSEITIRISNPRSNLTQEEVETVMLDILEKKAFSWTLNEGIKPKEAYIQRVVTSDVVTV